MHFLLELSDKPVTKSKIENLRHLRPESPKTEPALRWEDILRDDPEIEGKGLWRTPDYNSGSSDEGGGYFDSGIEESDSAESTGVSVITDHGIVQPHGFVIHSDSSDLVELHEAQYWNIDNKSLGCQAHVTSYIQCMIPITSLQAIREVLFMLSGTPTSLFLTSNGGIAPNPLYSLENVSNGVFQGLLRKFAKEGTTMLALRKWTGRRQSVPLLQTLQFVVTDRLRRFNQQLMAIEKLYVSISKNTVVSLVDLQLNLDEYQQPLLMLSRIILGPSKEEYIHPFKYLEVLFTEVSTAQTIGKTFLYTFLGTIFFECFKTYLRPMRRWMEDGELQSNDDVFFVAEVDGDVDPACIWQEQYKLRKSQAEILYAPQFLHTAASKIFTTGKSVVVLKRLGLYNTTKSTWTMSEPALDFERVCNPNIFGLVPFPELFDAALGTWIKSKHHATSSSLRDALFGRCGLGASLDAFENICFMKDGAAAGLFSASIFDKLDCGQPTWHDRLTLNELARTTLGAFQGSIHGGTHININTCKYNEVAEDRKSLQALACINIGYKLTWPVQIVITDDALVSYQRVFTFLLQIRRSAYMLDRARLLHDVGILDSDVHERALYYRLRSRLLWFTSTLYNYVTNIVILTATKDMRKALAEAEDIDQMILIHQAYAKKLTDQCLLGTRLAPIHDTIITLLELSIRLSDARLTHATWNATGISSYLDGCIRPRTAPFMKHRRGSNFSADSDHDYVVRKTTVLTVEDFKEPYIDRLRQLNGQFNALVGFAAVGLRGVARVGGEVTWSILADKLEYGIMGD